MSVDRPATRPPGAVKAAAILLGLYGALALILAVIFFGPPSWIAGAIGIVFMITAYGLWRGNRIARIVAIFFAGLEALGIVLALGRIGTGDLIRASILLLIGGLVFVPEESQRWFAKR